VLVGVGFGVVVVVATMIEDVCSFLIIIVMAPALSG
jgi:hypothetical protein